MKHASVIYGINGLDLWKIEETTYNLLNHIIKNIRLQERLHGSDNYGIRLNLLYMPYSVRKGHVQFILDFPSSFVMGYPDKRIEDSAPKYLAEIPEGIRDDEFGKAIAYKVLQLIRVSPLGLDFEDLGCAEEGFHTWHLRRPD